MLVLISPAKTLDMRPIVPLPEYTIPCFLAESTSLVKKLRKYNPKELQELMHINSSLADLTFERYVLWNTPFTTEHAKPALFAFRGAVYQTLRAETFSREEVHYSQDNLRILSGLYGILRPLDLIRPYRLEMGIRISSGKHKDLYSFWQQKITSSILSLLEENQEQTMINLASAEYFKVIQRSKIPARIITPHFYEERNGKMTIITIYTKMARGMMTRFILKNKLKDPEQIKLFEEEGYLFNERLSNADNWYFTR